MNIVVAASASLPGTYESEDTLMMWGYDFGWGGMSLMLVGATLCIAFLVILVWVLVNWSNKQAGGAVPSAAHLPPSGPSAGEILQQRYARGEIDTATFEQMREQLSASPRSLYQKQTTVGVR